MRCLAFKDTRAGHYERQLHTKAGEVTLREVKQQASGFWPTLFQAKSKPENVDAVKTGLQSRLDKINQTHKLAQPPGLTFHAIH